MNSLVSRLTEAYTDAALRNYIEDGEDFDFVLMVPRLGIFYYVEPWSDHCFQGTGWPGELSAEAAAKLGEGDEGLVAWIKTEGHKVMRAMFIKDGWEILEEKFFHRHELPSSIDADYGVSIFIGHKPT